MLNSKSKWKIWFIVQTISLLVVKSLKCIETLTVVYFINGRELHCDKIHQHLQAVKFTINLKVSSNIIIKN